ncbi:hypothetical protein AB0B66_21145 [Catellatospora sp. NPDC049111]|uniref:hypothetical protein n=1 Tax=Catellatospora sp. NPDC049111 TaxID=3155271 RepID=UPI0033C89105
MFEGYAGTSESGFRAEVEAEQALIRGERLLAMTSDHEHRALAGPAADEAARRLDRFAERARFQGTVVTDPHRIKRLMRRHDPYIHPGDYVTCAFNPDRALCQQRTDSSGTVRPSPSTCQPLDCRNAALTAENTNALHSEAARMDAELASRPTLPPLLLHQLTDRRNRIVAFLDRHTATDQP